MDKAASITEFTDPELGLIVSSLHANQIVAFEIAQNNRATVDLWEEKLLETVFAWPKEYPFLCIFDVSNRTAGLTPYSRQRSNEIVNKVASEFPDLHGRIGIILPRTVAATVFRLFIQRSVNQRFKNIEFLLTFDRVHALKWISEAIKQTDLVVHGDT